MATDHMGGGMTHAQLEAYRTYQGATDYDEVDIRRDYEDSLSHTVDKVLVRGPTVVKLIVIGISVAVLAAFLAPFIFH